MMPFFLGGRLFFGLGTKKAFRAVVEDDAEEEQQEGAQHGDHHDDPADGIGLTLGLEG